MLVSPNPKGFMSMTKINEIGLDKLETRDYIISRQELDRRHDSNGVFYYKELWFFLNDL